MKQEYIEDSPEYEALFQQMVDNFPLERRIAGVPPEELLAAVPPEQRVAGLAPEQRLAGLTPEQTLLALPDEVLRGFSEAYLRTLPPEIQQAIRKRIGRPGTAD